MKKENEIWGDRKVIPFNTYTEVNLNINPIFVIYDNLDGTQLKEFLYYQTDKRREDSKESQSENIKYYKDPDKVNKNQLYNL